jgi:exopolyphosphatase/guanosine-5'-triphosphate,3'-diphosphate pyrophosphatase
MSTTLPDDSGLPPKAVGAIDIGSNSIHLTLARVRDGRIEHIARLKDPARLAGELDARSNLSDRGIDRAVATLGRFRDLADVHHAALRATGTAALRAARNAQVLVDRAQAEAGVRVELITGHTEARLTYAGVRHGLPALADASMLCVDVGGGSTEVIVGKGPQVQAAFSAPVGSLVVTRRYIGTDPIPRRRVRNAQKAVELALESGLKLVNTVGFEHAIATSGTIQRVARMARMLRGNRNSNRSVHGMTLEAAEIDHIVDRLTRAATQPQRLCIPGMDPERADTLLAGALIFQALARGLGIQRWLVSMSALRTGLVLDIWRRG